MACCCDKRIGQTGRQVSPWADRGLAVRAEMGQRRSLANSFPLVLQYTKRWDNVMSLTIYRSCKRSHDVHTGFQGYNHLPIAHSSLHRTTRYDVLTVNLTY